MHEFGRVLERLRKEAGYKTAYEFYHKNGGRLVFHCGFRQYLYLEQGKSLPKPKMLLALGRMLRLLTDDNSLRDFSLSHLKSLYGGDVYKTFFAPILAQPQGKSERPLGTAIQKAREQRVFNISGEQAKLITKSACHYWAFEVVSNDNGPFEAEKMAELLGYAKEEIEAALNEFAGLGLIKKIKGGAWISPHAGKIFAFPQKGKGLYAYDDCREFIKYWQEMAEKKGGAAFRRSIVFRASESQLMNYFPYLYQALVGAEMYSSMEKGPDTALFAIETTAKKLFPF
ncbi:MAG: hypothetical protein HY747_11285 [Elusimicrobia bacterium]|nr:hypothetical protein [Elusimicrobiota bacterium]